MWNNWINKITHLSLINIFVFFSVQSCENAPVDPNSVREGEQRTLKYECKHFYKLEGPEAVVCQSNERWSEVPICRGKSKELIKCVQMTSKWETNQKQKVNV